MNVENELQSRSNNTCELCSSTKELKVYEVPPSQNIGADAYAYICNTCHTQIEDPEKTDANHWRCLNDSMWSQVPAVQVIAWRMLNRLHQEGWPLDLLDMLFLDEETSKWAQATGEGRDAEEVEKHKDSNGVTLLSGDSVVLIKDLAVKGTSMVAKRGTAVRRISLVMDNPNHIEGKVNGQTIVILTQYVKKSK